MFSNRSINFSIIFIFCLVLLMLNLYKKNPGSQESFDKIIDGEKVSISIRRAADATTTSQENGTSLNVEIANTMESTKQGLSGRDEIGSDGLLFVFPDSSLRTFWMVDMKFDLDFVWIDGNEVVGFSKNIKMPAPGTTIQDIERVAVQKNSDKVLELNSGDIDKYNLQVGDVVILK